MSDSETFLSRWLKLKGQSQAASPAIDPPSPAPFDLASLPPLHAIVADTDMQQFMHEAVPEEVTRAALRSAWTADPAVRDFVGIAENQWDFNDQTSMPGFGPIEAADYLATQALQSLTNAVQIAPEEAGRDSATYCADGETKGVEQVQLPAAPIREEILEELAPVTVAAQSESAAVDVAALRTHGRAMPR